MYNQQAKAMSGRHLRQAIVNLLDNAIKYSPSGSRILAKVQSDGDKQVFLDLVDQGLGIPTEHQTYVFDCFYRVDQARAREWDGAGLGLSITRGAVETHGGDINLESNEGHRGHVSKSPTLTSQRAMIYDALYEYARQQLKEQ